MFKKVLKFIKIALVGVVWSILWVALTRKVMLSIWNFDYVSLNHWKMVKSFWNANGTIRGVSDYLLFLSLFLIILLWFKGFKYFYKIDYMKILLKPLLYFSNREIKKYEKGGKHVIIKNLIVGEKTTLNDLIEEKIKEEEKQEAPKESETLRKNISKKIIERKGQ